MDTSIAINFDGQKGIELTQGEDRTILVTFSVQSVTTPIDITGAVVEFNFPRQDGGAVKRTSGVVTFSSDEVVVNPELGTVILPDNGLVTGDPVTVAAIGEGVLPSPLTAETNYTINTIDVNTFQFIDSSGNAIIFTDQGTGQFNIINVTDVVITNPTLGQVTLLLRSQVTAAMNAQIAQNFQAQYTLAGKTRINVLFHLLDVLFQPVP